MSTTLAIERGEIWVADLDPGYGTEPGKQRPVLIVQAQALLAAEHPSTLVVPLTTNLIGPAEPLRIRVPASRELNENSDLLIDQLRAIDNRRLRKGPLTRLSAELMTHVADAISQVLDIDLELDSHRIGRQEFS